MLLQMYREQSCASAKQPFNQIADRTTQKQRYQTINHDLCDGEEQRQEMARKHKILAKD